MKRITRMSTAQKLFLVLFLVFAALPLVAAKDFIIQDSNGNPILVVNGSTDNVGIGTIQPGSPLVVNGQASISGNLNMNNFNVTNLRNITNFFAGACGTDQVVKQVYGDGSYQCVDVNNLAGDTDNQDLAEVLVQGNVANTSINMSGNNISYVDNLFGDKAGSTSFFDASAGSDSERVSAIGADGTLQYSSILVGGTNIQSDAIDTYHIVNGTITAPDIAKNAINATHILAGNVTTTEILDGTIAADDIGGGAVGDSEIDNNEAFTMNGLTLTGDLDMDNNNISNVRNITGFFGANCGGSEVVSRVWSNGSYQCTDINTYDTDNQRLDEVLAQGNWTGGQDIVLNGSSIIDLNQNAVYDIANLYGDDAGSTFFTGTINQDETISGIGSDGSISTQTIQINGDNIDSGSIDTYHIVNGTIVADDIAEDAVNATHIGSNAVGSSELDENDGFTMNSLTVSNDATVQGDLFVVGNISNTNVENLNVNGSLLPPEEFDNYFDVGSESRRWANGFFGGDVNATKFFQNGNQVIDTITVNGPLSITGNDNSRDITFGTLGIGSGGTGATTAANARDNLFVAQNGTCPSGYVVQNATTNGVECIQDQTGTDDQQLGISGDKITLTDGGQIYAPFANNSDQLDGQNGSYYLNADNIDSGELGTGRFDAYSDLSADGRLANDEDTDLLTRTDLDSRFVNADGDNVTGNLNMTGNNVTDTRRIDFGNGNELVRSGGDLCLGDQCNG